MFLIIGAVIALIWANSNPDSYHHFVHMELFSNPYIGHLHDGHRIVTLHYLVNDILMALFFAIAGKEIREAMLPGGDLNPPKKAIVPLVATVGGMAGPALVFLGGAAAIGQMDVLFDGWAIPTATDIAFSYMVARIIFGKGHPAIAFLLLLAIADDAGGLIILAVFYPQGDTQFLWLLLSAAAVLAGFGLKRFGFKSFWVYMIPLGAMSWFAFYQAGIHPALGLVPLMWALPHAKEDAGLFAWEELNRTDSLNAFEHWFKNPVEIILFFFGLLNAGVVFTSMGSATWLVLAGLLVGKVLGIFVLGMLAAKVWGLPDGMNLSDLVVVGFIAGIGFTVALFVATVAFPPGDIQDAAKIGALFSFSAAIVSFIAAKWLKVGMFGQKT